MVWYMHGSDFFHASFHESFITPVEKSNVTRYQSKTGLEKNHNQMLIYYRIILKPNERNVYLVIYHTVSWDKLNSYHINHLDRYFPYPSVGSLLTAVDSRAHNYALQWRPHERDGVSNHQPRFLSQRFIQAEIKENIKYPRLSLCEGKSPATGEFLVQRASNAENVAI